MTKVDDPMPQAALKAINRNHKPQIDTPDRERLSGIEWLRDNLSKRDGMLSVGNAPCHSHYHAECVNCGSVKCVGNNDYAPYDTITQVCDCGGIGTEKFAHLIVPFDNFGRHFGFPE